jgi:hypothetical protein
MQAFASGEWGARPTVSDEFVYLFQAKTLLAGRLAFPSPPLPEFFEAAHLLVVPTFAAKYLPGHAAMLAPFLAAGVPWLGPCFLLGLTAALLFIAARLAGLSRTASIGAGLLLLGAPEVFPFFASYLSQSTSMAVTSALFVCVLMLKRGTSRLAMVALGTCIAFAALVRPFTGIAAGVTAASVLFRLRDRLPARVVVWSIPPLVVGVVVIALVCHATTGSVKTMPWALYARQYAPYDGPGIGAVAEVAPERPLPPQLQTLYDDFLRSRRKHTWERLPAEAFRRVGVVASLAPSWAVIPFALLGLAWTPLAFTSLFALVAFLLQLTFHVGGANYHLELYPWLALAAAAGAERAVRWAIGMKRATAVALCAALALPLVWTAKRMAWETTDVLLHAPQRGWRFAPWEPAFERLRQEHALVFVKYGPRMSGIAELTYNDPDLEHSELIRAIDKGPRDAELLAFFPNRPAFVFDLATQQLERIR